VLSTTFEQSQTPLTTLGSPCRSNWPPGHYLDVTCLYHQCPSFVSPLGPTWSLWVMPGMSVLSTGSSGLPQASCLLSGPPGGVPTVTYLYCCQHRLRRHWGLPGCCEHHLVWPLHHPGHLACLMLHQVSSLEFFALSISRCVLTCSISS
jgi:hypothetical protein